MKLSQFVSLSAAAMLTVVSGTGYAQESVVAGESPVKQPGEPGGEWAFTVEASPSFTFRADMDDEAGSVSVFRTGVGVEFAGPVGDRLRLSIGVDGEVSRYEFDDFGVLGAAGGDDESPLEDGYEAGVSLLALYSFDDRWYGLGRGSVRAGWADDADLGDAIWGSAAVGVGYKFSDSFSLALGGGFITRLEDNVAFLPLVVLNWQIDEKVSLSTTGVGLKLTAKVSESFDVFLRGGGDFHQYRVDDDNQLLPGGVVNDTRVPIGVGFDWRPVAGLTVSLEGGAVVYQQFEFRNDDGDKVEDVETDPAAFIGGRVSYRF